MDRHEAADFIFGFLLDYVSEKKGFAGEFPELDEDDEVALLVGHVFGRDIENIINIIFWCTKDLDPDEPPVTKWVKECVEAARAALPEAFAVAETAVFVHQSRERGLGV